MATIAVFLVLSGGTAVALNGSNTVFSDDIVNGEVKAADIGSNAVGSGKILDGGVHGLDIFDGTVDSPDIHDGAVSSNDVRNNAITSGKVQDESLIGADVVESSLGTVPSASNADSLNGQTAGQLEGARAFAIVAGNACNASGFCPIVHGKRVATPSTPQRASTASGLTAFPPQTQRVLPLSRRHFPNLMSGGIGVGRFMETTRPALDRSMRSTRSFKAAASATCASRLSFPERHCPAVSRKRCSLAPGCGW